MKRRASCGTFFFVEVNTFKLYEVRRLMRFSFLNNIFCAAFFFDLKNFFFFVILLETKYLLFTFFSTSNFSIYKPIVNVRSFGRSLSCSLEAHTTTFSLYGHKPYSFRYFCYFSIKANKRENI